MNVNPENKAFIVVRAFIVVGCLISTLTSVLVAVELQARKSAESFSALADESLEALETRFHRIDSALVGAAGLVRASSIVSVREWSEYVATIRADRKLPKVEGIGWVSEVRKDDGSFARLSKRLESRGFSIHPMSSRNEAFVLRYMAPNDGNLAAIGLDLSFEDNRREMLEQARETNEMVLSRPVVLVQDAEGNVSFVICRPIFGNAKMQDGFVSEPGMSGWVVAPFLAKNLFSHLTIKERRDFDLTVYSGDTTASEAMVFSTKTAASHAEFSQKKTVQFYGRELTFVWDSTPTFVGLQKTFLPNILGLVGLVLTALVTFSTFTNARRAQKISQEIDERTRELRASMNQTKAIIENAMIGLVFLDSELKLLSANPAFLQMFEIEEPVISGYLIRDFIPDFPLKAWEGTIFITSRTNAGNVLNLKVQVNRFQNKFGRDRYVVMFDDVTKEQAITDNLREAEHRISLALSTSEIGIYDIDLATGRSVVSDSWVTLMGLERETLADNPQDDFFRLVHADDVEKVLASHDRCIEGLEDRAEVEYRVQSPGGDWRWMKSSTSVAGRDEKGVPNRLIGSQIDFTELHNANEKLRASRHQFEQIVKNSPVPLALLDDDGFFTQVNQALLNLAGYSEENLVGRDFQTLIYPDDLNGMLHAVQQMRDEKLDVLKVEVRCIDKSGRAIWMLLSVSRASNNSAEEDFFIAQFVDISQRKETEKNNREFFANMSHELRTPLTSVKGAIDLVMGTASSSLPENVRGLLGIAQGNSERLAKLLNDLLDLEKVSTDRMQFNYEAYNIATIVSEAVEAATPIAQTANVRFETELPADGLHAWIDAPRMEQILLNLLSNAVKYSDPGKAVKVVLRDSDGDVLITVKDNGAGIPASYHDKVFQPFSQADSSATRKKGGTGLGLSIAKSLVETMGGKIGFKSIEGSGTEFWIRLPNGPVSVASQDTSPIRVLHVEPDKVFAGLLEGWLGDTCNVVNVGTLVNALARLGQDRFDALILNRVAADVENEALLCHLKEKYPHVVVVSLAKGEVDAADGLVDLYLARRKLRRDDIVKKCLFAMKTKALADA